MSSDGPMSSPIQGHRVCNGIEGPNGGKDIIFICSAKDYHAMHRYRLVKNICASRRVAIVTDSISSEGFEKLVAEDDVVIGLFNIDWLMFPKQSKLGNAWRNLVKLLFLPLQALRLRAIARENPDAVFHAVVMYYMCVSWIARIPFVGTPQGSEILVRTERSRFYRYFAIKSLLSARHVCVDSVNMQEKILDLCGREAVVMQNGIDVDSILQSVSEAPERKYVVSIRGLDSLYRISEILDGRANSSRKPSLRFIYPLSEETYRERILARFIDGDEDLGRLPKERMYELLASSKLAISIPRSDSSPRSVYEAVFCGCCVAVTYNRWIDALPDCMRERLFLVNLDDRLWLEKALNFADSTVGTPFIPDESALNMFDEKKAMRSLVKRFYQLR